MAFGSILFVIAAFLPISKVYMESNPENKLEIIQSMPKMWNIEQVMFIAGSIITAFSLFVVAIRIRSTGSFNIGLFASIIILIAAFLWSWHAFERILSPEGFVHGKSTPQLFIIYSILTQLGLALLGFAFLSTDLPAWIGWLFMVGGVLLFILMISTGDMPPFAYYLLTLILSLSLLYKAVVH
jgi:hypothetical protein